MNFWQRLRGNPQPSSRETAKQRLQLVLVHDRNQIEPGMLERIKDEIIAVISKHVEIDPEHVKVTFSHGERENRLTADIPLLTRVRPRKQ
jgi:cell division topological specificity factor